MQNIGGIDYYTVEEAARLSGASVRTVRRWISGGRLTDFLFPYRMKRGEVLYRLEPPGEGEVPDDKGVYSLVRGGDANERVGRA